jgi:hypothetical protein
LSAFTSRSFLFRDHPGEDVHGLHPPPQVRLVQLFQIGAGDDLVHQPDARLTSDALGRGRVVAGNHYDPNARRIALPDGGGDGRAHRVGQTYEAQKLEREVVLVS